MTEVITNDAFWDAFFLFANSRVFIKNWVNDPIIYHHPVVGDMFSAEEVKPPGGAAAWVA